MKRHVKKSGLMPILRPDIQPATKKHAREWVVKTNPGGNVFKVINIDYFGRQHQPDLQDSFAQDR